MWGGRSVPYNEVVLFLLQNCQNKYEVTPNNQIEFFSDGMTIRKKAVDQKFSFNPPDLTPLRNVIFAAIAALLGVGALLGLSGKMKAAT